MKTILTILAWATATVCLSQPYTFSTYTSEYVELSDGIPVDIPGSDTIIWNDPEFTVPLSGNFQVDGIQFSSIKQIFLGGTMGFLDGNGIPKHIFGIYFGDIVNGAIVPGDSASTITYANHITPETTQTVIQFSNVAFYTEVSTNKSTNNRMNFQFVFETPSNAMEIHFGPSSITDPELIFDGNPGPSVFLAYNIDDSGNPEYAVSPSGNPENPSVDDVTDNDYPTHLNAMPASGRVYRFEPATNGVKSHNNPSFRISPTLTTDQITLSGNVDPYATFRIFDITGKKVMNGSVHNHKTIDVSDLNSGLYLFSIYGNRVATKFVKQ